MTSNRLHCSSRTLDPVVPGWLFQVAPVSVQDADA